MKYLDLPGLQYFYDKYIKPIKNAVLKSNIKNDLITEDEGYVLDARQGKVLDDKINNKIDELDDKSTELKNEITELDGDIKNTLSPALTEIYSSANGTVHGAKIGKIAIVRFSVSASETTEREINYNADYAPAINSTSLQLSRSGVLLESAVLTRDSSTGRANLSYKAPSGNNGTYTGWATYITYD